MEYELGHYYRVKYALVCARQSFLREPPKDYYEEYAPKVIGHAYFLILNKIDELDGTNERLLKYYRENVENYIKLCYDKIRKVVDLCRTSKHILEMKNIISVVRDKRSMCMTKTVLN